MSTNAATEVTRQHDQILRPPQKVTVTPEHDYCIYSLHLPATRTFFAALSPLLCPTPLWYTTLLYFALPYSPPLSYEYVTVWLDQPNQISPNQVTALRLDVYIIVRGSVSIKAMA